MSDELLALDLASEIYSTAGRFDILAKFHVDDGVDIGLFVNRLLSDLRGVRETETIIAYKAFA